MAGRRELVFGVLAMLVAVAAGARHLNQYAQKMEPDESKECPGYGNVGNCMPICNHVHDKVIDGFDETVSFTVELFALNITSGDTLYTTCDPISGDIADYSTGEILTSVQDLQLWRIGEGFTPPGQNSTCPEYPDAGLCESICDYLMQEDRDKKTDKVIRYQAYLKDFNLMSQSSEMVICMPDSGLIVDYDSPKKRLATVRKLTRPSYSGGDEGGEEEEEEDDEPPVLGYPINAGK
jgi:hypothetical protein